jgi:hypothetical protein
VEQAVVREVVREHDGETLGRVVSTGSAWRAETVFGGLLAESIATSAAAEMVVREQGLAALAEPWWLSTPTRAWTKAWLLEVEPRRVRVSWTDPKYGQGEGTEWVDARTSTFRRNPPGGRN